MSPLRFSVWLIAACWTGIALGEPLLVGPDWGILQRRIPIRLIEGTNTLRIGSLPPHWDPATLELSCDSRFVRLLDWSALAPPGQGDMSPASLSIRAVSDRPLRTDVLLRCLTRDLGWSAYYQVAVEGYPGEPGSPLFVDISARIRIENETGTAIPQTALLLASDPAPTVREKPLGFLMVDTFDPLSDLWRESPQVPAPRHVYPMRQPLELPPLGAKDFPLIRLERQPASSVYRLDESVRVEGAPHPLDRWIEVAYEADGNRDSLPAGRAQVSFAGQAAPIDAFFPRTPPGGRLRMRLGPEPSITVQRGARRVSTGQPGFREETHQLMIESRYASEASIELHERPDAAPDWSIVSCSVPHERQGASLVLRTSVPSRESRLIRYTLRVRDSAP